MNATAPVLITATAPTPNGALHLGHLSGPYVAADIAARAARARAESVRTVGGVDPHQNYVAAKAAHRGDPPAATADTYAALIRRAWRLARVDYDIFVDPAHDLAYQRGVRELLRTLVDRKAVECTEITLHRCADCGRPLHHAYVSGECPTCGSAASGGTCEECGSFLRAGDLVAARCLCGGTPRPAPATVPVLSLERYREPLTHLWSGAVLGPRVRDLVGRYLATGLPDVPLAYPTDRGIAAAPTAAAARETAVASDADIRVDVWVEMGLGYLHAVARHLDPAASGLDAYREAWGQAGPLWHFLGIDNAFYYAILFPALAAAAEVPGYRLGGMVVNEFYRLDGAKFSTSQEHAVWAHDLLAHEDPGLVRLFLTWDRPDRYKTNFTRAGFDAFVGYLADARQPAVRVPEALADQELARAAAALTLPGFDPAVALRCLCHVLPYRPEPAGSMLRLIAGGALPAAVADA